MQEIKGRIITVKIKHEQLAEIDRISERLGIKRNEAIRNCLDVALDVFHGYEKIGVWKIYEIQRRMRKKIKEETQPSLFKV
jgi:hypothetical protein